MTSKQIDRMLPGPQWARYRKRLRTERLLTTREIAAALRVDPATVRVYIKRGYIPAVKVGNRWRFDLAEVMEALHHDR